MRSRTLAVPLLLLLPATLTPWSQAEAQETIASDRPGIGSGSYVLELGTVQAEGGVAYANGESVDVYSIGQLLIRIGTPYLEAQALLNSFVIADFPTGDEEGFQDFGFGLKARLYRQPESDLAVSVLATLSVPTGADFLSSDEVIPAATLLADYALSDRWALSTNLGYALGLDDVDDVFAVTLTPSVSLPVEANLGAYFGYAGFFSSGQDQHFLEGGLALLANVDVQLDLNAGVELDSGDYFIGVGVAARRVQR